MRKEKKTNAFKTFWMFSVLTSLLLMLSFTSFAENLWADTIQSLPTDNGWSTWDSKMCCNGPDCSGAISDTKLDSTLPATKGFIEAGGITNVLVTIYSLDNYKKGGGDTNKITKVTTDALLAADITCLFTGKCGDYTTYGSITTETFKSLFCGSLSLSAITAALNDSALTIKNAYMGSYGELSFHKRANFIGVTLKDSTGKESDYLISAKFSQDNFCTNGTNSSTSGKSNCKSESYNAETLRMDNYWGGTTSYDYATANILKAQAAADDKGICFRTPYEWISDLSIGLTSTAGQVYAETATGFFSLLSGTSTDSAWSTTKKNAIDCYINNVETNSAFYTDKQGSGGFTGTNDGYSFTFDGDSQVTCEASASATVSISKNHIGAPDKVQKIVIAVNEGGTIYDSSGTFLGTNSWTGSCTIGTDCSWKLKSNLTTCESASGGKTVTFTGTASSVGAASLAEMKAAGETTCGIGYTGAGNFTVTISSSTSVTSAASTNSVKTPNNYGMKSWY